MKTAIRYDIGGEISNPTVRASIDIGVEAPRGIDLADYETLVACVADINMVLEKYNKETK